MLCAGGRWATRSAVCRGTVPGAPVKMTIDKYSKRKVKRAWASIFHVLNHCMSASRDFRRFLWPYRPPLWGRRFAASKISRGNFLFAVLFAVHLLASGAWAQTDASSHQTQGGWQGLGRILDAITPSVDTRIAASSAQITDHIEKLLARGMFSEALQAIAARKTEREAAASPGVDVQLLFLEARALAALQRREEALAMYRHMTERYPELPEPWNNLAAEYMRLNQPERAQEALQMALTADPNYATAQANLGTVRLMLAQQSLQDAAQSGLPDAERKAQAVRRLLDQ